MGQKCKHIIFVFALIISLHFNVSAAGNGFLPENSIYIYPNPIVYEANITLDKGINLLDNEVSLIFFNIVGEEIHTLGNIQNHQFRLNKELFKKSGIYLYQLKMNGEVLKTGKISIH